MILLKEIFEFEKNQLNNFQHADIIYTNYGSSGPGSSNSAYMHSLLFTDAISVFCTNGITL